MTAFAAVLFFVLLRGLVAGYGGLWFFPVLAGEAMNFALPLLAVAIADGIMRRLGVLGRGQATSLMTVVEYVVLFALFASGWIDPHTTVAAAIGLTSVLNLPIIALGLLAGLLAVWLGRRLSAVSMEALLWAAAGCLIEGPQLYLHFDQIEAGYRLLAGSAVAGGFVVAAVIFAAGGRSLGGRRFHVAMAAAVVAITATAIALPGPAPTGQHRSVVLIVVDTLRADTLERRLGSGRPLMPRLSAIARRGLRFDNAIAPSPWTLPSTTSMLSGASPFRHGVGRMAADIPLPGKPAVAAWARALRRAGYQVAGFVNNPYLRPYYGFGQAFLRFSRYHGNARDGTRLARSWIVRHRARPFLSLLHLMDPHWPYEAPLGYGEPPRPCAVCSDLAQVQYRETSAATKAELRRRYEAEVAFTDAEIGRLWDALDRRGILEDAWFIVTSDHGEEFWEHHRFLHGHSLFDELLHVPLILVPPKPERTGLAGRRIARQVRLEDVGVTILDIAGAEGPGGLDGASLLGLIEDPRGEASTPRPELAGFLRLAGNRSYAVRTARYKLIIRPAWPVPILYDLKVDRAETRNVAAFHPEVVKQLGQLPALLGLPVGGKVAGSPVARPHRLAPGLLRELRSLGYLH